MKDLIMANFSKVWPLHVKNFTEHLIACRRTLGDLDLVLVLAVIGDRTLPHTRTDAGLNYTELFEQRQGVPEPEDVNLRSIAEYTGIPRETVRRKVNELVEKGWIEKNGRGYWVATAKCNEDLTDLTRHGIKYLAQMAEVLDGLKT